MLVNQGASIKTLTPLITQRTIKDITTLPVSVLECVQWQNQQNAVAAQQGALITDLILTAREMIEKYCWIDITPATYQALFDISPWGLEGIYSNNIRLVLQRAPIFSTANITLIEYLDDTGAWVTFDVGNALSIAGLFDNVTERIEALQWATLYFNQAPMFDARTNAYKIRVTFFCGYDFSKNGDPLKAMPISLKTAIKKIVAWNYANRGDVIGGQNLFGFPVPDGTKALLDNFSVAVGTLGEFR